MQIVIKRFGDILVAILAIIVFLPFFIPIIILLKLTGEGYIFYFQDRIGYKNKKFRIWKFATMLKASPSLGTGSITTKDDWRLTPMGGLLRKTKINELPQIVNVLLGEMSIVGPRPQMESDFMKYSKDIQLVINNVKPGITGIASIIFRDEQKYYPVNCVDPHEFCARYISPYKGQLELWYQEHAGLKTDFIIVLLTVWVIFFKESEMPYKIFKEMPKKPKELHLFD